jgi:hypothetical protein
MPEDSSDMSASVDTARRSKDFGNLSANPRHRRGFMGASDIASIILSVILAMKRKCPSGPISQNSEHFSFPIDLSKSRNHKHHPWH